MSTPEVAAYAPGVLCVNTHSILLVDTNRDFLRIVKRLIQEYYHEDLTLVGTSFDEDDALSQAQRMRPRIILLGLEQAFLEGLRLIPKLRAQLPEVGIIVLGSHDMIEYRRVALEAGADAFVAKFDLNRDLLPSIWQITRKSSP